MKNMVKAMLTVLALVLVLMGCAMAEEIAVTAENITETVEIIEVSAEENTVALRAAADGMSEIVAMVSENAEKEVLSREGDWLKVSVNGTVGYLFQPAPAAARLDVFTSRTSNIAPGSEIVLSSKLTGLPEGCEVTFQWQCDCGNGFENIEGATSSAYVYTASMETLNCSYRLVVSVKEAA